MKKEIFTFTLSDITDIAVLTAMSIVLDTFVKIPLGQTGGSLNFSLVPLFVVALRHGPFKAFIAGGIIYGLVTCLIDGYGFQTYPLEYLVAFGTIFILGFFGPYINRSFKEKNTFKIVISIILIVLSIAMWGLIRWVAASIDSVLFYEATFRGGLAYNAIYVLPTTALDAVLVSVLAPTISAMSKRHSTSFLKAYKKEETPIDMSNEDKQDV